MRSIAIPTHARTPLTALALIVALASPMARATSFDLTVMTQNMYFGTGLGPVIAATTPPDVIAAVTAAFGNVVASQPESRIARLADEIAAAQPHVIGLQEASLWRTYTPSVLGGGPGPEVVRYDFVQQLLDELAARGQSYALAVSAVNIDAAAPGILSGGLSDIRLTDREAILVRTDLPASQFHVAGSGSGTYGAFTPFSVLGQPLESLRNYAYVDLAIGGRSVRVVSTHLDPDVPAVQVAQGDELIAALGSVAMPLIVMGDFNSPASGLGTPTYANMLAAGFGDAWLAVGAGDGFTCCQAANLLNNPSSLDERIDYVFERGLNPSSIVVIGDEPGDRTASGRWPSDHAGLLAVFAVVPEPETLYLLIVALPMLGRLARRARRGSEPIQFG
jgi:endonuclease/exonuclease/phosphatase family metal-dependent hydrolase